MVDVGVYGGVGGGAAVGGHCRFVVGDGACGSYGGGLSKRLSGALPEAVDCICSFGFKVIRAVIQFNFRNACCPDRSELAIKGQEIAPISLPGTCPFKSCFAWGWFREALK